MPLDSQDWEVIRSESNDIKTLLKELSLKMTETNSLLESILKELKYMPD